MKRNSKAYLGTGWSFPPSFDVSLGAVEMVSAADDIARSLAILFSTEPGERPMYQDLGCAMRQFQFEGMTQSLITRITDEIQTSIENYEPRIENVQVEVSTSSETSGRLDVSVAYQIRTTNSRYNVVFPFYLSEGSSSLYFDV